MMKEIAPLNPHRTLEADSQLSLDIPVHFSLNHNLQEYLCGDQSVLNNFFLDEFTIFNFE